MEAGRGPLPRDDVEECRASNAPRPFTTAKVIVGDNPARESEAFSWAKVEELVRRWADEVKRDVDTPDLWADLERDGEILTGARFVDVDNTPFTLDEQAEIAVRLLEIIEFAKTTYALSSAQVVELEAKFDAAKTAAGRIGRKDWLLLFFGVMFTVIVGSLCPQRR